MKSCLLLAILTIGCSVSQADTILFTTFGAGQSYDTSNGYTINAGNELAASFSSPLYAQLLSVDVAVEADAPDDQFTMYIESGDSGPTTILDTISGLTFPQAPSSAVINVPSVAQPAILPGETYWVVLAFNSGSGTSGAWMDNNIGAAGNGMVASGNGNDGSTWNSPVDTFLPAFDVVGGVPEPSSIALAGLGLGIAAAIRARRVRSLRPR